MTIELLNIDPGDGAQSMKIIIEIHGDVKTVKSNGDRRITDFTYREDRICCSLKIVDRDKEGKTIEMCKRILEAIEG